MRCKMFLLIVCLVMLFSFVPIQAQAAVLIIIDGIKETTWGTPLAVDPVGDMSEPNLDLQDLYVIADTDNYYIGFDAFASTWGMAYGIYIDTDQVEGSGGTSDPWGRAISAISMYLPEYTLYVWHNDGDTLQDAQLNRWDGSGWSYDSLISQGGEQAYGPDSNWIEYRVPKAALDNSSRISLELFTTGGSGHAQDSVPSDPNVAYSTPDWGPDTTILSAFALFQPPLYVRGNFNSWGTDNPMYDDGTHGDLTPDDGILTSQVTIETIGQYEFKVAADDWSVIYPESGDSWLETTSNNQAVTITFDTNINSDGWLPETNIIGVSTDPGTWTAVGDWQGWNNNNPATVMTILSDGVYELITSIASPGSYQYKAVKTGTWHAIGSDGRSVNADNVIFTTSQADQEVVFQVDAYAGRVNVTVNSPPFAYPNGPYLETLGTAITFNGSGSGDADGIISTYDWDFGDGMTGSGISPVHTYASVGTYTVTLTVTDDDGATDTATTTATIISASEAIEVTLSFIEESIASGELAGVGNGNSANGKLGALINMLENAYDLINEGDIEEACNQLNAIYKKCDGNSSPPDFISGVAASDVANMIVEILISLGCE